jgi:predicted MFS family arabinose efflux permease
MQRAYDLLIGEDEHGCGDLPDAACRDVPANAARLVGALGLQNVGDSVVDAKTVLAWLLAAVGAPAGLTGLLVPVREAGSLVPQASLVPWVRRFAVRKRLWVLGAGGQAAAVAVIAGVAATTRGAAAGWIILGALACFAVARAVSSIASKDVLGRTIPKGQRGRITGLTTVLAGVVAVTVGVAIPRLGEVATDTTVFVWLLAAGAGTWVCAGVLFATVTEPPGPRDDALESNWLTHALRLLRDDAPFRRFVSVRTLLLVSALSPPFVVALATREIGVDVSQLGPFVVATGIASILGGPVWGRFADRSSRSVMATSAGASTVVLAALLAALAAEPLRSAWWLYPLAYFLLALAHTGARVGRKTYVVDLAEGNARTDYVATSNTAMGLLLLATGVVTGGLAEVGVELALAFLAALGAAGAVLAGRLPEVTPA